MRSSRLTVLALAGATACWKPDVTLHVRRGAPSVNLGVDGIREVRPIGLPARPFLNRYDLLEFWHGQSLDYPVQFVDYLHPPEAASQRSSDSAPWSSDVATETEAAQEILAAAGAAGLERVFQPRDTIANPVVSVVPCARRHGCVRLGGWVDSDAYAGINAVRFGDGALAPVLVRDGDSWVVDADPAAARGPAALYAVTTVSQDLLTFVHVSDVQIREATAKVESFKQSKGLDQIIDSFEHDFEQELYVDVVLHALVETINATVRSAADHASPLARPAFVIHTGDAIDAGLESELDTFHRLMDRLAVPWLSAIGNHDVLTFGNLIPHEAISTDALAFGARNDLAGRWWWTFPVQYLADARWRVTYDEDACRGCADGLVAKGGFGPGFASGFIDAHARHHLAPAQRLIGAGCGKPAPAADDCVAVDDHGFALGDHTGYYAFTMGLRPDVTGRYGYRLRVIVLDTEDYSDPDVPDRGGEGGYLSDAQMAWLDAQLKALAPTDLALVFGHHPLATLRDERCGTSAKVGCATWLRDRLGKLATTRQLLAYITGHKHRHAVTLKQTDDHKAAFWEIETASIIGFPQEARWISIRTLNDRIAFLELLPFGHGVVPDSQTPIGRALERAERGARRDQCRHGGCVDGEPVRDGSAGAVRLFVELPTRGGTP